MENFSELFPAADRVRAFDCLGARTKRADAGETLFREGRKTAFFGVVLSGAVDVVRYGADGRERLLMRLGPGEAFGTSFVLGGARRYFANVVAAEKTEALLLDGAKVLAPCERNCPMHARLLARLVATLARRNSALARKLDCLAQRTTREKLRAYLEMQAEAAGSDSFDVPFSRQQLAEYLNVDRAALSTEIGKMARDGILRASRRHFELLRP